MGPSVSELFTLQRGDAPLLISIPHLGKVIPEALRDANADWRLDRLDALASA
jgi:N-formylglutamate deformylase